MFRYLFRRSAFCAQAIVCLSSAGLLSGCYKTQVVDIWLSVEVEDNGVIYTGSAEQHASCSPDFSTLRKAYPTACGVSGDAVALNIPGKPLLYLLMQSPVPGESMSGTEYLRRLWRSHPEGHARQWEVAKPYWPQFAVSQKPTAPADMTFVDPADLTAIYGENFHIRKVRIQVGAIHPWTPDKN